VSGFRASRTEREAVYLPPGFEALCLGGFGGQEAPNRLTLGLFRRRGLASSFFFTAMTFPSLYECLISS
jgi:hypothetical protein